MKSIIITILSNVQGADQIKEVTMGWAGGTYGREQTFFTGFGR